MKVVTGKEMAEIDRRATEEFRIPSIILMENASLQAAQAIKRHFGAVTGKKICVVCGKGNNGGDGLALARHLTNQGAKVNVFLLTEKKHINGDAKTNLEIAFSMNIDLQEVVDVQKLPKLERAANNSDLIVDAIFGTGLHAAPRDFYQGVIQLLNASKRPIIAIDIPTGISSSSGQILGSDCIHANLTVTFGLPKFGLLCSPHQNFIGKLEIADIGIPRSLMEDPELKLALLEKKQIKGYFTPRVIDSHKGSFGHVLVIAGSPGKTGAAVMAAQAALRSGAGIVTLGVPKALHPVVAVKTTEVMTVGLSETSAHTLAPAAMEQLLPLTKQMKAIAIGPGMSNHPETIALLKQLLANLTCPIVLDADGITNLTLADMQYTRAPLVITPHPGEMARLLNVTVKEIQESRLEAVQKTAMACKTCVVLKGQHTLISDPEGNVFVNQTGNPGMATAGTGDVLTGTIAGFMAQGFSPIAAAQTGVFLHGLAGDLACKEKGQLGMIATDVLEKIPSAILDITA